MPRRKKQSIEGDGLFSDTINHIAKKTKEIAHKVVYGRNDLSPKVMGILGRVGDAIITGITIGRTELHALLTGAIKTISSTPYDKLYHLFLILKTDRGNILLEKNEVINMDINKFPRNAQTMPIINVPAGLTINQLLQNTERRMGKSKFLSYSAYDNNCQNFILSVLQANGINEGADFVKQNTESIFKNDDVRKFANTVTDVAGRANVLIQGGHVIIGGEVHRLTF